MKWILLLLLFCGCADTIQLTREQSARYEKEVSIVLVDNHKAVRVLYDNDIIAYFWLKGDKPGKQAFTLLFDNDKDGIYESALYDVDFNGDFDLWMSGNEYFRLE